MSVLFLNMACPLIGAVATGSLGVVALSSGRALWRLAVVCFLLMTACLAAFGAVNAESHDLALFFVRLIPAASLMSLVFSVLYVAELEELTISRRVFGYEFSYRFGASGSTCVVVWGKALSLATYTSILLGAWGIVVYFLASTDWLLADATVNADGAVSVRPGPLVPVAGFVLLSTVLKVDYFLIQGWRVAKDKAKRRFTEINFLGFSVCYVPVLATNLTFVALEKPVHPMVFMGLPVAVTLFYVAIVRYQFAQIDELNKSLEAKVRARTRALEQAQTRFVQSEKMGSLGRLVAGIAHEVNNPISAISGMQQTLGTAATRMEEALHDVPEGTAGRERLEKLVGVTADAARVISSGSERIAQVVYRLRRFARLDGADVQDADISEGIREAVEMVRGQLADGARISVDLPALPELRCDIRALNQVWLNVLTNAADALPAHGGEIRVTGQVDREEIFISVHDNGRGMSPSELARALDPGYTTKGVGVGTGLGLPICYQIVEDHGGHIELDSAPGRGTSVSVGLQRVRRTDRPVPDVVADAQSWRRLSD